ANLPSVSEAAAVSERFKDMKDIDLRVALDKQEVGAPLSEKDLDALAKTGYNRGDEPLRSVPPDVPAGGGSGPVAGGASEGPGGVGVGADVPGGGDALPLEAEVPGVAGRGSALP